MVVEIDDREIGGARGWDWIKKGIPLRVEIGPRDIAENSLYVGRRDKAPNEKSAFNRDQFVAEITEILDEIQENIFQRALAYRKEHTIEIEDKKTFYEFLHPRMRINPKSTGALPSPAGAARMNANQKSRKISP